MLESQPRGFSLQGEFYRSPQVFEAEVAHFLGRHWVAAGHVSEIPEPGDFFVFEAMGASLIVVRGREGEIHALHNVCRHRGARICEVERGRTPIFRCRYHNWSYRLNGELASWRHMGEGLDKADYGLRRCGVAVFAGVILVSLDPEHAPDVASMVEHLESRWARYDLARCQVAARETYRLAANWKLCIENNLECYHCLGSHPEYTAANAFVRADEKLSDKVVGEFAAYHAAWRSRLEAARVPTGRTKFVTTDGLLSRAGTWPLAPGQLTASRDGQGVAPLLGRVTAYDESATTGGVGFLSYLLAMCDYALIITYLPQTVDLTHVVATWLVREGARAGVDFQPEEVRWLWDETTKQDKSIIELNARGVASRGYVPGPYSALEWLAADFVDRYLKLMAEAAG